MKINEIDGGKPEYKYPRTFHVPFSPGFTSDDKVLKSVEHFVGKEVVVTEKMDGENSTISSTFFHARSLDSKHHSSRDWLKTFHKSFAHEIPQRWRICGENLYAKHSIEYTDLPTYFMVFSIWNEKNVALSWDDTVEWCNLLGLHHVPVLWRGIWDEKIIRGLFNPNRVPSMEGWVVRTVGEIPYLEFKDNVAKFVREAHVTTDQHWTTNWTVNKLKPQ